MPIRPATVNNRRPYNAKSYGASAVHHLPRTRSSRRSRRSSRRRAPTTTRLQVTIQKRLTKGFSAQGFYVWSKALQSLDLDTSGNTGNSTGTEPEDNNFHYLDRQRSDYDQRHVVAASIVWKPHYGFDNRFARAVINDWTFTSIIRIQSGAPFNITTGSDNNFDGVTNDRPNLIPGLTRPTVTDNGNSRSAMVKNWVSASQFCAQPPHAERRRCLPAAGCWTGRLRRNGSPESAGCSGTARHRRVDLPRLPDLGASTVPDPR